MGHDGGVRCIGLIHLPFPFPSPFSLSYSYSYVYPFFISGHFSGQKNTSIKHTHRHPRRHQHPRSPRPVLPRIRPRRCREGAVRSRVREVHRRAIQRCGADGGVEYGTGDMQSVRPERNGRGFVLFLVACMAAS